MSKKPSAGRPANDPVTELGAWLRKLRAGQPIKDLAEAAGISHQYWADLERGRKTNVRKATRIAICLALGVPVDKMPEG